MSRPQAGPRVETKPETSEAVPALKPRQGLFIALMIALVVWVGFLLVMYFTTVAPRERRKVKPPTTLGLGTAPVQARLLQV